MEARTKAHSIPPPISPYQITQIPLHPVYRNPSTRSSSSVNRIVQNIRIGVSATRLPLVSVSASPLCSGEQADETELFAFVLALRSCLLSVFSFPICAIIFIRRGPENRRAGNSITHTILREQTVNLLQQPYEALRTGLSLPPSNAPLLLIPRQDIPDPSESLSLSIDGQAPRVRCPFGPYLALSGVPSSLTQILGGKISRLSRVGLTAARD